MKEHPLAAYELLDDFFEYLKSRIRVVAREVVRADGRRKVLKQI